MKIYYAFFMFLPFCAFGMTDCATMRHVPDIEMTLVQVVDIGLCRNPNTAAAYASLQSLRFTKNAFYSKR